MTDIFIQLQKCFIILSFTLLHLKLTLLYVWNIKIHTSTRTFRKECRVVFKEMCSLLRGEKSNIKMETITERKTLLHFL